MADVTDKARPGEALTIGRFEPNILENSNSTGVGTFFLGGNYEWLIWGVFDGASCQLQQSPDQGMTWINFNGLVATDNGRVTGIPIGRSMIRVEVSGAGVLTNLFSQFTQVAHGGY